MCIVLVNIKICFIKYSHSGHNNFLFLFVYNKVYNLRILYFIFYFFVNVLHCITSCDHVSANKRIELNVPCNITLEYMYYVKLKLHIL